MQDAAISLRRPDSATQSRHALAPSSEGRRDVALSDHEVVGSCPAPDAQYNHRGTIVVASVWLVLYVIMAVLHFMAPA